MKVYIVGPMGGRIDNNYSAFFDAESMITRLGHKAINPARLDSTDTNQDISEALKDAIASIKDNNKNGWEYYIRRDLSQLMEADALCVLPGWQDSRGASIEVNLANSVNMPILILKEDKLVSRVEAIGLSGYSRSGKNTVGRYLENQGWKQITFADYIRKSLYTFNPRVSYNSRVKDIVDAHGWETGEIISPEIKILLQRFGTEVGRDLINEDIWVDLTVKSIPDGSRVVFTDCRFSNEANKVRQLGGKVWRVNRPGWQAVNDHTSETSLVDYDFDRVFINDSSIKDLDAKVEIALRQDGLK